MPKLDSSTAGEVNETSASSFEPLEAGVYYLRLRDVDGSREGPSGPYWSWEFDVVQSTTDSAPSGRLWNNTSLSEAARFKLKETFDAFGVPADTDTDDLVGQCVKAVVSIRTIQSGARKGEPANQIDRLVKPEDDWEAPAAAPTEDDLAF
jgi:hypothetical protein